MLPSPNTECYTAVSFLLHDDLEELAVYSHRKMGNTTILLFIRPCLHMKFSEVKEKWKCLALENYEVFGCGINLAVLKTIVLLNLQQFLSFRRFRALSASPAVFFFLLCVFGT